jgi:signal transduction histidine kinase
VNTATRALETEQDAARSRDELVHMLVHDLRNPVQGIALQAGVALQIASKSLDMEREHLSQIERTCHELSCLLQDMLEIAGLETGQMRVACSPLRLGDLVDDVPNELAPTMDRAGNFCRLATEQMRAQLRLSSQPGLAVFEISLSTLP